MLSRMRAILRLAVATIAAISFMAGPAPAQSTAATISGTVVDASGAVVPGAKVDITNTGTAQTRSVETGNKVLGGPYTAEYTTKYTVVKGKNGLWLVDRVSAIPKGTVK